MSLNNMINKLTGKTSGSPESAPTQSPSASPTVQESQEQKYNILPHPAVRLVFFPLVSTFILNIKSRHLEIK